MAETTAGSDSLLTLSGEPQIVHSGKREYKFTPLSLTILADIESRVRSGVIEAYLRGAQRAGIPAADRDTKLDRLLFTPLEHLSSTGTVSLIDRWLQSPTGINYVVWRALSPHWTGAPLEEDAMPFTFEERLRMFRHILVASGLQEPEPETPANPTTPPASGTKPESVSANEKPVTTGGT